MLKKKPSFFVQVGWASQRHSVLFYFVLPQLGFWVKMMEADLDTAPSEKIAWLLLLDVGGQHPENVLPPLVQQLTLERHRPAESDPFGRIPSASPWMPHRQFLQSQVVQPLESHRPTESRASRYLQHPVPRPCYADVPGFQPTSHALIQKQHPRSSVTP